MRRGAIVRLVTIGVLAGLAAAAVAIFIPWLPAQQSREAGRIDFVFWFVVTICIAVFAVVAAVIIYSVFKFRVSADDDLDGPPIHGHTGIEIVWTAVPAALVTAIAIVSTIALAENAKLKSNRLRVNVTAQQCRQLRVSGLREQDSNVRRVPLNRSAGPDHCSAQGRHPLVLGAGVQAETGPVPGLHPTLHITPNKVGTYPVICTELCGLGHAVMRQRSS